MKSSNNGYQIISREPNSMWINSRLVDNRLDPNNYDPKFLKLKDKITSLENEKLDNIVNKISNGYEVRNYKEKGYPYLRVSDLEEFTIDYNNINKVDVNYSELPSKAKVEKNDLLVSRSGTIGIAKAIKDNDLDTIISSHLMKLKINTNKIDVDYLAAFINSKIGKLSIEQISYGAITSQLGQKDLLNLRIPIPSDGVQKYIGDKVRKAEKLREEAKKIREKAEKKFYQIVKFNDYTYESQKSYNVSEDRLEPYLEANYYKPKYLKFYDYLNNLEFEVANLNDILAEKPQKSNSPAKKKRVNDGIPSLIVSDIDPYEIELEENKISVSKELYKEREGSQLREDDVIFTTAGPPLGETTIIVEEALPLLHGSHVTAFRCNETCHPGYLTLFLNSELGRIQTKRHCYGIRQKYLFNKQLYKFKIVLLPKELQKELGDMIINSIKMEFESKQLIEEAKQDVEDLIEGNLEIDDIE
ncbi:MAG: restriction endonuclease subunit S [Bacillota bacterium]